MTVLLSLGMTYGNYFTTYLTAYDANSHMQVSGASKVKILRSLKMFVSQSHHLTRTISISVLTVFFLAKILLKTKSFQLILISLIL